MQFDIKLSGMKAVLNKIRRIRTASKNGAIRGVHNSLKVLKMQASSNLEATSARGNRRSHMQEYGNYIHKKINSSWKIIEPTLKGSMIAGGLQNLSDHAAAVEFGVGHSIFPTDSKRLIYKIGGDFRSAPFVTGQMPKAYIGNAMLSTRHLIPKIIADDVMQEIISVL